MRLYLLHVLLLSFREQAKGKALLILEAVITLLLGTNMFLFDQIPFPEALNPILICDD